MLPTVSFQSYFGFCCWHLTILEINLYQKFVSVTLNRSEQNIKYKFISTLHVQMKFISLKLHDRRCALVYFRKSNGYLRQSSCSFSISVPCVRENNCKKCKKRKTGLSYRNFSRFSKLLSSASAKLAKARLRSFASQLFGLSVMQLYVVYAVYTGNTSLDKGRHPYSCWNSYRHSNDKVSTLPPTYLIVMRGTM